MTHDPMCPSNEPANLPLCRCDLIARVREDEQTRIYSNEEIQAVIRLAASKAYAAALRDAKAAVMAVSGGGGGLKLKVHEHYRNCIAAIEVLGGAR